MSDLRKQAQKVIDSYPLFYERTDEVTSHTVDHPSTLQINVGRLCNLSCRHCHMEAGPDRTEVMSDETLRACLDVARSYGFSTIDITGGSPEMNPGFEWFIEEASKLNAEIIVRSNLVILDEAAYSHLPEKYADLGISVYASLPHYTKKQSEKQRGDGTFDHTIKMLKRLNGLGYGKGSGLVLNLVFNPSGALLPPNQQSLENDYRKRLGDDFGIEFDYLFAIANNPLGRFGERLYQTNNLNRYMDKLVSAFNPATLESMMCRNHLSVGWDGRLYDCDFNQAAGLPVKDGKTIADYAKNPGLGLKRKIVFGNHCYACCAGSGGS
ncbi:MAG: arsenosugar biosynthesis radical SAM protein ArsS [Eggerthellaceae bacterium]|nr:arsenosugar biosynthesis radical SAM protein ArsS [Eggerthellaceae bacterium]